MTRHSYLMPIGRFERKHLFDQQLLLHRHFYPGVILLVQYDPSSQHVYTTIRLTTRSPIPHDIKATLVTLIVTPDLTTSSTGRLVHIFPP
eukprot:scaffold3091_cov186-Alexandrium_tamarense.AAC.10